MILINGKPFLEFLISKLKAQNIVEIVLCIGYGADTIEEYFGSGEKYGVRIFYSRESKALGTGGAIKNAERFAVEDNLILNGDSYLELDFLQMHRFHHAKKAQISIACTRLDETKDYGNISIDSNNRILTFAEKISSKPGALINGGVYLFDNSAFSFIPRNEKISIEKDTFPQAAGAGRCYAFLTEGYFIDIGTPERLRKAQVELKASINN